VVAVSLLNLMGLVSVIAGARVHFGGDSGALHLALMAGIPTVSWFRKYDGLAEWAPCGPYHTVLVDREGGADGLTGITADHLSAAGLRAINTACASKNAVEIASVPQYPTPAE
jgi:hypothetical protein